MCLSTIAWVCYNSAVHHGAGQEAAEAHSEARNLVELLELRAGALAQELDGGFPELRASVWQSEASVQAAVQARTTQRVA